MSHSDLYTKARIDTRKAYSASNLARLFKAEKVIDLGKALEHSGPGILAELFMMMSYAPYSGAVAGGLNDGKANKLSQHLLTAILTPFVDRRSPGSQIDLKQVQSAVVNWVDHGCLGDGLDDIAPDLQRITTLLGAVEPRVALSAPFAAPIELSILALEMGTAHV